MQPYPQGRCYSHNSHTSSRNDAAEAILLGASASNSPTDNVSEDPFAGIAFSGNYTCTPGAGNLAYGQAAPDVDRAWKLEEEYQQLKRDIEDWNARVEDTTRIFPLLKRKQMFSDAPGHRSIAPKKHRQLQVPFEFSLRPTQSKTVAEAMSSIEGAIERQTLVLSKIFFAIEMPMPFSVMIMKTEPLFLLAKQHQSVIVLFNLRQCSILLWHGVDTWEIYPSLSAGKVLR
ncbi:hypothetical protein DFH29DRAFT_870730 [Suillus ampliporus]|nr:hypothetical protein DFH29DRAFT_870730 [Suillus ampliporus]